MILTSSSEDRDLINGYDLGANSHVRKPIQFDKFAHAVAQLGVYWLMINEPAPTPHRDRSSARVIDGSAGQPRSRVAGAGREVSGSGGG